MNFWANVISGKIVFKSSQIFHYARCITLRKSGKSVYRVCGSHLHVIEPKQHSAFRRNVAAVASRWQHCVQFDWSEI